MRLNIDVLAMDLFSSPYKKVLDLDTGKSWTLGISKEIEQVKQYRVLPSYTRAPIYQKYCEMVREKLGIDVGRQGLEDYPQYKLLPDIQEERIYEYLRQASHFAQDIDRMLNRDRMQICPKYPLEFPTFGEYLSMFTKEFAKEWCEKEGYEWYEE